MTFLAELANHILENKEIPIHELAVILPNKRAAKLLQQSLIRESGKPIFSPAIFSIDNFIESLSPNKKLSKLSLLIKLFSIYKELDFAKEKNFVDFISWGEIFLHDINDIDMQLADATQIFKNIGDIKELETSFGKETLTANQTYYINFYTHLKDIYVNFTENLLKENSGYDGLLYRDVAENMSKYAQQYHYKRYIFAGLSTLSLSEIKIIQYYRENFNAEIYFDYDVLYAEHYRTALDKLKIHLNLDTVKGISNHFATVKKTITQVGISKKISQIYYAIDKLNEIKEAKGNLNNTALVFADESLLLPFIHSFDCSEANLTMGFPLKETSAYILLQTILDMVKNENRFKEIQNHNEPLFYHKDLLSYFQNPIIKHCSFTDISHKEFIDNLTNSNRIFIKREDISQLPSGALPDLEKTGFDFVITLIEFFTNLISNYDDLSPILQHINLIINGLKETLLALETISTEEYSDIKVIEYFIHDNLKNLSIPFKGDFDQGLQIMGLLETRGLDFENVIMLSVNEGILPKGKTENSLILYNVKKHFKLPTYEQKDSVYAYHFFRLLQRAKNVFLIYNNDSSDSLAEKSRFINQLEFEIKNQKIENNVTFCSQSISIQPNMKIGKPNNFDITKDENIIAKLRKINFSASNLTLYINCPLQFYLASVEKIESPKTISENIELKVIGSVVHEILKDIIATIKEDSSNFKIIIENYLKELDNNIHSKFKSNKDVGNQDIDKGRLFLATEITFRIIKNYLEQVKLELEVTEITVLELEKQYNHILKIGNEEIQLKGFVDRIDIRNNKITILDYKTGKVDEKNLQFNDMTTLFSDPAQKILFQLFVYSYLYYKNNPSFESPLTCGIISFREINMNTGKSILFPLISNSLNGNTISPDLTDDFETSLKEMLTEIFNPSIPFRRTEEFDHCKYCDYRQICGR